MARREYGGSLTDFTTDKAGLIRRGLDAYFWATRTGGTPLTDIVPVGTAGTFAGNKYTSGTVGAIDILGPDGYDADGIWTSATPDPAAARLWLRALDIKGAGGSSGGGGGGTVGDASAFAKGVVQLAGDLGGGASAPAVVRINGQVPATVATTGAYADLLGKPAIPSAATLAADPAFAETYALAAELVERAQDAAAAMFRAGTNITFAYDDAAGTLTINALGGGSGGTADPETVRDTIAAALVGGANLSVVVNDAADTITIAVTGLAPVATSGSYSDLLSKPTIPTVGAAGSGSSVALASTDATTTNARTPTSHATSHGSGGSDAISPAAIGAEVAGAAATARAFAIQRANHTGTQAATTITGLATVATSGAITDLTGTAADAQLPSRLAATALDAAYQQTLPVVAVITAAATLVGDKHTPIDASGGAFTVTLPTPTRAGQQVRVEKVDATTNTVAVTGTLRGATGTLTLRYESEVRTFIAESLTSWRVASGNTPKAGLDSTYAPGGTAGNVGTTDARLSDQRTPLDGSVTNAKIVSVAATKVTGLAAVATTGAAADLTGLAAVARSGSAADLSGTLPQSALPPLAINDTFDVTSQAAMLALTAQRGDVAVRVDLSPARMFFLRADNASQLSSWIEITAAGSVISVAGRQGAVVLSKGDVGLGNVDNTSDATKPVSTPQADAIAAVVEPTALPRNAGVAASGVAAKASRSDHVHPRAFWTPDDHGLVSWTYDPCSVNATVSITSGLLYMLKMHVPVPTTITNLILFVTGAGSGLTAGQSFAALYDSTLTLRGQTADQSTNWTTTGPKVIPLTSPVAVAAGDYYLAFYSVGTTRPNFSRGNDSLLSNIGLSAAAARWSTSSSGLTTAPPATAGALTAINPSIWGAMS